MALSEPYPVRGQRETDAGMELALPYRVWGTICRVTIIHKLNSAGRQNYGKMGVSANL
jgi:hypothetical protein